MQMEMLIRGTFPYTCARSAYLGLTPHVSPVQQRFAYPLINICEVSTEVLLRTFLWLNSSTQIPLWGFYPEAQLILLLCFG